METAGNTVYAIDPDRHAVRKRTRLRDSAPFGSRALGRRG